MKKKFLEIKFSATKQLLLDQVNEILEDYSDQGLTLTLRQCYYQLVTKNIIANNNKEYAKLSKLLTDGRMAGEVDWNCIEDRVRRPRLPYYVDGISDALTDTVDAYRLDRQKTQENYIEVWVEKDALSSVLSRVTNEFHINLMVNRGYSSCSAIHDAYQRMIKASYNRREIGLGHRVILYMGDHDPSGLDMIRDIAARLNDDFGLDDGYNPIVVEPIALTMDQIKKFNPPPNPAKITDPRAKWYIQKYGNISWELDALPPKELDKILRKSILKYLHKKEYDKILLEEKRQITELQKLVDRYKF